MSNASFSESIKDALPYLVIGSTLVGSIIFGWSDIQNHFQDFWQDRNQTIASEKAKDRYRNGCLLVFSFATKQPTSLVKGQPIYNEAIAGPSPEGTTLCSQYGGTAIVKEREMTFTWVSPAGYTVKEGERYPVVTDIAVTGQIPKDARIVDKKLRAYLGKIAETKN